MDDPEGRFRPVEMIGSVIGVRNQIDQPLRVILFSDDLNQRSFDRYIHGRVLPKKVPKVL
jgi:hypothetical protein